jgi:hypothetical protein
MNDSIRKVPSPIYLSAVVFLLLVLHGCSTFQSTPADPEGLKSRVLSKSNEDVQVSVALPTIAEAREIYGANLAKNHIQPIWVSVKNKSSAPYWFLYSGLDPDYFFPSEASFAYHTHSEKGNRATDEKFRKLHFKNPVMPGSTETGFVLVNLDEGFKAIDIDLVSRHEVKNFSFVTVDPDFRADFSVVDFKDLYDAEAFIDIENEEELRQVIEAFPCCTTNAKGDNNGDPINLVLIGDSNDIISALVRRNWHATEILWSKAILKTIYSFVYGERYRYSPISPLYVFGRNQDIGWQKARSSISKRNHMRFWLSPFRYKDQRVFVGQISRDIGVKFTLKSPTISTHVIDPDVDEARRYFTEDMAYSQAVARIGFLKGVGAVSKQSPRTNLVGDPYYTDGYRAVLFFTSRPHALSNIEIIAWETPSGHYFYGK